MIDLSPSTFITMLADGKRSCLPVKWWIERGVEKATITNLYGKILDYQILKPGLARRISCDAWYQYSNPVLEIGMDEVLVKWQVDRKGHGILAGQVKVGEKLDGKWGCFNVAKASTIEIALVRINATDAFGLFVEGETGE